MQITFSFLGADDAGDGAHVLDRAGAVRPTIDGDKAVVLVSCGRDQRITPQQYITMANLADECSGHEFVGELCAYSNAVAAIRQVRRAAA